MKITFSIDFTLINSKAQIENLVGNFFEDGIILLDINGLKLFESINKNAKFYFGENLKNVKFILKVRKMKNHWTIMK